jgi:hypothetical protein
LTGTGILAAVLTGLLSIGVAIARGGALFSPGPLNAQSGSPRGGVTAHADLSHSCPSCHPAFWTTTSMADLCVACHGDISSQWQDPSTLHGSFHQHGPGLTCRSCHPDHQGPDAPLTSMGSVNFAHSAVGFALTGAHAGLSCIACHAGGKFTGLATTCVGCHTDPAWHAGSFGIDCAGCHNPSSWAPAAFNLPHPAGCGEGGNCVDHHRATCLDCHTVNVHAATCTKCHRNNNPGGDGGGNGAGLVPPAADGFQSIDVQPLTSASLILHPIPFSLVPGGTEFISNKR